MLCEGAHDVAFLKRLLSSAGYISYNRRICDFPFPVGNWMARSARNLTIENLNVDRIHRELGNLLPYEALHLAERDILLLLYSMNGDSSRDERRVIMEKIRDWISKPDDEKEFSIREEGEAECGSHNYGLILFYDADEKGIDRRIEDIKEEIGDLFPVADTLTGNGDVVGNDGILKIGAYIFADTGTGKGALEQLLLPLMKSGNEEIFKDADDFLNKHRSEERLKPLVFSKDDEGNIVETRKKTNRYYHIKSVLGVVGQLQNSGASNVVCIGKSDYITLGKIRADLLCGQILAMFNKF